MRSKTKHYSLIRRITAGFITIYAILLILMTINSGYAIYTMQHNVYDQLHDTIEQDNKRITSALYDVSSYLASFKLTTANLSTVEMFRQDNTFYSALYKLRMELSSTLTSMSFMQGLFVFPTNSQLFISSSIGATSATVTTHLRSWMRESLADETLDSYVSSYWFPMEIEGRYYLIRLLKAGQSYIGAWTDFSEILSYVNSFPSFEPVLLYACDENIIIDTASFKADYQLPLDSIDQGIQQLISDHYYLAVSVASPYTEEGGIYLLVRYSKLMESLRNNYIVVFLTSIVFLLIALFAIHLIRRHLGQPLYKLQDSLTALRGGDFSIRLETEESCNEFADVNVAFNQMVERIENLKIDIYEEKLFQQKTEMQSLKNQIAPHFLINCLNAIYHMAASGDSEGIQHMTVYLGDHLRYALADVSLVPLQDELDKAMNYINLSKIRLPGCIETHLSIDDTITDALVPPMILLFQVENIIKYEVVNGEITEIHLEIYRENPESIHLRIWDTGSGYATEVIEQLQSKKMLSQSTGHNIGTRNTIQRLYLMFGDQFTIQFSNRDSAGAQVDIVIPYQTTGQ